MSVITAQRPMSRAISGAAGRQWTFVGLGALTIVSGGWLVYEFWRLLFQPGVMGAVDLLLRYEEVHRWFSGQPVYAEARTATYPPASVAILWPFVGWLTPTLTRWLWAVLSLLCLGWLAWQLVRASGADQRSTRLFVTLLALSSYAAGAAIGNGQLIVVILPCLLGAIVLLHDSHRARWPLQLVAATLLLAALVKPTLAAPFFWIALFAGSAIWPTIAATLAYIALTLFAAQFQSTPLPILLQQWLANSQATAIGSSGANLHAWLAALGLGAWISAVSVLVLLALGAWTYRYRHADLWLLIGVASIVANFWSYHLWYDDLVLVLPAVALFRLARSGSSSATILLAAWVVADLAPGGLYLLPQPLNAGYVVAQTILRLGVLAYLIARTRREATAVALFV